MCVSLVKGCLWCSYRVLSRPFTLTTSLVFNSHSGQPHTHTHTEGGPWLLTLSNLCKHTHTHTKQIHPFHSFILHHSFRYLFMLQQKCARAAAAHLASAVQTAHTYTHKVMGSGVPLRRAQVCLALSAVKRASVLARLRLCSSCHHNSAEEQTFGSQQKPPRTKGRMEP